LLRNEADEPQAAVAPIIKGDTGRPIVFVPGPEHGQKPTVETVGQTLESGRVAHCAVINHPADDAKLSGEGYSARQSVDDRRAD
jgi:hypothetical protein